MAYRLEPFTPEWEPAAARSNARLSASGQAPFLLPERATTPAAGAVMRQHYLAVDDAGDVRGGCLLQSHPAHVENEPAAVVNIQSPLSEGLFDRRFAGLGPWMLRELVKRHPLAYCVGMGREDMPFPRLLRALGWRLEPVPFYFRVLAGRLFLANMEPLRRHPRFGLAARLGGCVPLVPDLALALAHAWRMAEPPSPASLPPATWESVRARYAFAMERSPEVLDALYPPADPAFVRLRVPGAFGVLKISAFRGHPYFGDLSVATLAEAAAVPGAARALLREALSQSRQHGAGLLLANFSAAELQQAMREEGWLSHTSNFLVGFSPTLARAIGDQNYYLSRGDGDGLLNL